MEIIFYNITLTEPLLKCWSQNASNNSQQIFCFIWLYHIYSVEIDQLKTMIMTKKNWTIKNNDYALISDQLLNN